MQRFRGGLVFKAHRLVYHSTLGLRVIKKKKKVTGVGSVAADVPLRHLREESRVDNLFEKYISCRVDSARFRAKREQLEMFQGLMPESKGQNLALTVLFVLYSLDSG